MFKLSNPNPSTNDTPKTKKQIFLDILMEQIVDSLIVAGIVGLASSGDTLTVLKAFGLAFLVKMKEYRKLTS